LVDENQLLVDQHNKPTANTFYILTTIYCKISSHGFSRFVPNIKVSPRKSY